MCILFAEDIAIVNINILFISLSEVYPGLVKYLFYFFYKMVWKHLNKLFGQPNIFFTVRVEYYVVMTIIVYIIFVNLLINVS